MLEYPLYIGGSFVPSSTGKKIESVNPFDGSIVAVADAAVTDDVQKAVAAARKAFDEGPWPHMNRDERATLLKGISEKINERFKEFVELEVLDSGSTIRKAKEDVHLSARNMYYFSKLAALDLSEPVEGLNKPGFSKNILVREPIGVVGAIIPWNFPLKMAVWKLGPALAAGNTIVLKPSEITPVTAMELAKIIDELGFPPGVVNIIPGYGREAGEALVKHPGVDKIAFTGSTAVGKHIMSLASNTLKKCTLECGGKSANIVYDDADLPLALDGSLYAIFYHQGQCCEAGARLFLPASIAGEFTEKLLEITAKLKLGNPMDTSTDIGPVISKNQQERVLGYISKGIAEGATLLTGGKVPESEELANGFFIVPTIFTNVDNRMTIAQEEIFGPVLSIITYDKIDDAIRMANDSMYGLAAGVWSKDAEKADYVARRLKAGTVWINEWHLISEKAPFGGYKESGIGREFGVDGLKEYTETKHIHIDEVGVREKKQWYDVVVPRG
jgi:acyl-CoA reductase-like NAD-dependent aldehyde dehydrogenase